LGVLQREQHPEPRRLRLRQQLVARLTAPRAGRPSPTVPRHPARAENMPIDGWDYTERRIADARRQPDLGTGRPIHAIGKRACCALTRRAIRNEGATPFHRGTQCDAQF